MAKHTITLLLILLSAACLAEDKPSQPRQIKHRVTGLFSPEREKDLRDVVSKLPDVKLVSVDFKYAEATFEYDPDKLLNKPKPNSTLTSAKSSRGILHPKPAAHTGSTGRRKILIHVRK